MLSLIITFFLTAAEDGQKGREALEARMDSVFISISKDFTFILILVQTPAKV